MVFPLDLQDVEEVGCRGVHLDEILVRSGFGVRQLRHFELMRPLQAQSDTSTLVPAREQLGYAHLDILSQLDALHVANDKSST